MKINLLHCATTLTILIFIYTAFVFLDQTYQAKVITDSKQLDPKITVPSNEVAHLKNIGFSDIMIAHLTPSDREQYKSYQGKVLSETVLYRKNKGEDVENLTENQYNQLIKDYSVSKLPKTASLERIFLKMVYIGVDGLGNNRFLAITEHHFDYTPHDLVPMRIELQLGDNFDIKETARQVWWTTSSWNSGKIDSGANTLEFTLNPPENNQVFPTFIGGSRQSHYYTVHWKQPSLFEDVVGLEFYTITEFSASKDATFVDLFIQGENPHLSAQIQGEVYKAK